MVKKSPHKQKEERKRRQKNLETGERERKNGRQPKRKKQKCHGKNQLEDSTTTRIKEMSSLSVKNMY